MMNKSILAGAASVALVAGIVGSNLISPGNAQFQASPRDKEAVEQIVREYILENPEIIAEALDLYAAEESVREDERIQDSLAAHLPALRDPAFGHVAGATGDAADVVVVEFFDYHCGYCKSAADFMVELIDTEPDVQVVFRELPVLREESEYAAKIALAAREQGKYSDLHFALMRSSGLLDEDRIDTIARDAGVNLRSLHAARDANSYDAIIDSTFDIAIDIGLTGTPSFVVAATDGSYQQIIPMWDPVGVTEAIEAARQASGS